MGGKEKPPAANRPAEQFPLARFDSAGASSCAAILSRRPSAPPPRDLKAVFYLHAEAPGPKMNEVPQLATAMLAIAFAAVMLVAGQLYIEKRSARLPAAPAAL